MTRNDTFFKILFAIEIALLPLVMASFLLMPHWTVGLFIAGILAVKIWLELFKNKEDKIHQIIMLISNVLTIATLIIFFMVEGYINIALGTVVVVLAVLCELIKFAMTGIAMPEMIDAVDTCFMMFTCLLLIGLTFVVFHELVTTVALFTLLLTALVSIGYKVYHAIRFQGVISKITNWFRGLFRRKR